MQLMDGAGSGYVTKVDSTNRAWVRSVAETEQNEQASLGLAYSVPSGFITLTNASESALMYLRNDSDQNLLITRFIVSARASTGGTQTHARILIYKNPTGMTGGSGSLTPVNLNFGSSNTLTSTSTKGQQGAALTGGSLFGGFVTPLQNIEEAGSSIVLPKGASIGITCIPPTGNTSLEIGVGFSCHLAPV